MDVSDEISIVHEILPIKRKVYIRNSRPKKKKILPPKKMWVSPLLSERLTLGFFHCKHAKLRDDPVKFMEFYHMSPATFDELCDALRPHFNFEATMMRKPIPFEERIATTMRFLASGCTYTDLMFEFRIGTSTISQLVKDVCTKICHHLKEMVMTDPNSEKWKAIADDFYKRSDFPNCVGAIDAKQLKVIYHTGRRRNGEAKRFSVSTFVLLAICDSNYLFTDVDVIQYDQTDPKDPIEDPGLFGDSNIGKKLYNSEMNLPNLCPLPKTERPNMPFVLVAGKAFGLARNVMRPYASKSNDTELKVFNCRLSKARRFIECTFAIFSKKWGVFHKPMTTSPETADKIFRACVLLHNFILLRDGYCFEDTLQIHGFCDVATVIHVKEMGL
ncbi:uncharacterized protein LOC129216727 [Uloborus diversus]|uniref:uncharacterized protein LOC129216727 n=1 Tax=Uloborus diversus TaxID=327109 RepID=UPI00240A9AEA|nr:uncharacterized protein LOC129216727 [Uloborus diversus]